MNLQNRLEKLEQAAGVNATGEECRCGFDVRYYDKDGEGYALDAAPDEADRTPNKVCDGCGRVQPRINVVYVQSPVADSGLGGVTYELTK
jgi:hypothetical protein